MNTHELALKHGAVYSPEDESYPALYDFTEVNLTALIEDVQPKWISVDDRLPEFLEGKDYSANVFGAYKGYLDKTYISIFNRCIVDITEEGHIWAWARLAHNYGDLLDAECEWDDDYEVFKWMPLPDIDTAIGEKK
jgi:hypothetical protein